MSKFLGFIHHLMFGKIKFQESLVDEVLKFAEEKNLDIKQIVDSLGTIEKGELEDIIDHSNIHGWLDERVKLSENRLAKAVCETILQDDSYKGELLDRIYQLGAKEQFEGNAKEAYGKINEKFSDGMPCDGSITLIKSEEDSVIYQVNKDLHSPIWEKYTKDHIYWDLREKYIEGFLSHVDLKLNKKDSNIYEIG